MPKMITTMPAEEGSRRQERGKSPLLSRIFSFLLLLVISFNLSISAYAYSVVHIQASIDLATWEILTGVVRDEVGLTASSPEWKRMEKDVLEELSKYEYNSLGQIDSAKVATRDKSLAHNRFISGVMNLINISDEKGRVLTFPTNQDNRNSSTSTDMESALNANNAIVFDLNQAFRIYCEKNNIVKTPDATEMLNAITEFMNETSSYISGDNIKYYSSATDTSRDTNYRWRVEKYQGSSEKITWSMLIVEAFTNFSLEGEEAVDADNVYAGNPNQLTKAMVQFFEGALESLRGILGLWSMDELLFNEGWRSSGYVGGIFPVSWEPIIWALFMFTEIIAAMIVLVGIVMSVLKQAASTMNTIARIHAMSQIEDLLICGLALAILPLGLRMVIALSGNLVDIISAIRPDSSKTDSLGNPIPKTIQEMVSRFSSSNGTVGGIIAQCLFFGAQVYFNFFYALRALSTAILIIMAPMMISLISVSSARKQVTMTWLKELLANILVQPIHTFCITVILLLPASTHGFDNLIAIYAMIPFTSMIRSLFFGPAGGFMDQAAGKGAAITNGAISGAAMGMASKAGSGLFSVARDKFLGGGTGSNDGSSESGSSNEGGSAGGTNTDLNNASAERNSNTSGTSSSEGGSQSGGTNTSPNGETGGADGSANSSGGTNGAGGSDTTASSIASAQNSSAPDGASRPAPQNQPGTNSTSKSGIKDRWNSFKNSKGGQMAGGYAKDAARVLAGAALGGIGGAFTGAGLHQIGAPISNAGDSLIAGRGRQRADEDQRKEDENNPNQQPNEGETNSNTSESGADVDLSRPANQPVDLGSVGKRRANDSSGTQEMQVRDLNQKELDKQGISDIDDNFKTMEFTAKGDSPQAKELGAYADYLKALPPEQRRQEVNDRGIEATRTDDGIQVRIDKNKWSQANDGAKISSWTNAKTGDTTMRIKSPEGAKVPSFTGAVQKDSVHSVDVPKVTHTNTSTKKVWNPETKTQETQEIPRPRDVEQKLIDKGITGKAAAKAAERVGAIRELEAQGMSPSEAARQSKDMVSHISDRKAEVSIPKAELSPAQTATMISAVQAGETVGTPSVYRAEYDPGTSDPVFGQMDSEPESFSGYMDSIQAPAAPTPVSTAPAQSPTVVEPISGTDVSTMTPPAVAPIESGRTPVSMPASPVSDTNGTSTISSQAPASRINPALAQRAETYKAKKQETGSVEQAFKATKAKAPTPAPNRGRAPSITPLGSAPGVNMGRPEPGQTKPTVSVSPANPQPRGSSGGIPRRDTTSSPQHDSKDQPVSPISEEVPEVTFGSPPEDGFPQGEIPPELLAEALLGDESFDPGEAFDPFDE